MAERAYGARVTLAPGKVTPGLVDEAAWPYELVGGGYAALGLVFLVSGERRRRAVEREIAEGEFPALHGRVASA